ncbi:uncharacterized protein LOC144714392 [Wolffia australiana]
MEGKKQPKPTSSSSSSSPPSSSSLVADLFGGKSAANSSSFFHSVFPPASTVMKKVSWRGQNGDADGGGQERNAGYHQEKIDPCSFSSSLYYGGQDICTNNGPVSTHGSGYNNFKRDGDDEPTNPNAVSRGNWWQGSLYY